MLKISNARLQASIPALQAISQQKIPLKAAFKLAQVIQKINAGIAPGNELRQKIVAEFSQKDEKGETVHPLGADGQPNRDQVLLSPEGAQKLQELSDLEAEIDLDPIPFDIFGDKVDAIESTAGDMMSLTWLFTA